MRIFFLTRCCLKGVRYSLFLDIFFHKVEYYRENFALSIILLHSNVLLRYLSISILFGRVIGDSWPELQRAGDGCFVFWPASVSTGAMNVEKVVERSIIVHFDPFGKIYFT